MINRAYQYDLEGIPAQGRRIPIMTKVVAGAIIVVGAIMATGLHSPYPFLAGLVLAGMWAYRGDA